MSSIPLSSSASKVLKTKVDKRLTKHVTSQISFFSIRWKQYKLPVTPRLANPTNMLSYFWRKFPLWSKVGKPRESSAIQLGLFSLKMNKNSHPISSFSGCLGILHLLLQLKVLLQTQTLASGYLWIFKLYVRQITFIWLSLHHFYRIDEKRICWRLLWMSAWEFMSYINCHWFFFVVRSRSSTQENRSSRTDHGSQMNCSSIPGENLTFLVFFISLFLMITHEEILCSIIS